MMGYNESDSVQLYTNEQGRIDLGSLRLVRKMTANIEQNGQRISRSWRINDYFETVSYGNCSTPLTLKAGETLSLPLPCCTNVQSDIIAIRKR